MPVTGTKEQGEILKGINAAVRFSEVPFPPHFDDPAIPEERRPKPRVPIDQRYMCEVVDRLTNRQICLARGNSEQDAFNKAVTMASSAEKPKTAGQIAQENIALRKRVAELEKAGGTAAKPVTAADLVAEIETRGLRVPAGSQRTKKWREACEELLAKDDEMSEDMEAAEEETVDAPTLG